VENKTSKVSIVSSVIIAGVLIFFIINASQCHGDTCDSMESDTEEYQVFSKMEPEIINKLVSNNEIILLDVREDFEWDAGHITGAKHIALGNIDSKTTEGLSKDIPIYVYCRSGSRAEEAELKLHTLGFNRAENIGGITYWQERGGKLVIE